MGVQCDEEGIHIGSGVDAGKVKVPMHVQPRRIHFAPAQLQQCGDVSAGCREVEGSLLCRRWRRVLHRRLGHGQIIDTEIRRLQPIDLRVLEAFQQLGNVIRVGPGRPKLAMGVEIQDHTVNVYPLMPRASHQRRERRDQRFQHRVNLLGDVVVGYGLDHADRRSLRRNWRSFSEHIAADQKDHNKDVAYDE